MYEENFQTSAQKKLVSPTFDIIMPSTKILKTTERCKKLLLSGISKCTHRHSILIVGNGYLHPHKKFVVFAYNCTVLSKCTDVLQPSIDVSTNTLSQHLSRKGKVSCQPLHLHTPFPSPPQPLHPFTTFL